MPRHIENIQYGNGVRNVTESVYASAPNIKCSFKDTDLEPLPAATNISNCVFSSNSADKASNVRIEKFEKTLRQKSCESKNSFFNAVL